MGCLSVALLCCVLAYDLWHFRPPSSALACVWWLAGKVLHRALLARAVDLLHYMSCVQIACLIGHLAQTLWVLHAITTVKCCTRCMAQRVRRQDMSRALCVGGAVPAARLCVWPFRRLFYCMRNGAAAAYYTIVSMLLLRAVCRVCVRLGRLIHGTCTESLLQPLLPL